MHTWRRSSIRAKTPIALTIGNFDGVHLGHQAMLTRLKDAAKRLGLPACVMTFEPHPREFFAPDQAPARLTSLREKLKYLIQAEVDCIHVCRFNYDFARINPEQFITRTLNQELSVRWLLVGDDFRFGARRAGDFAMLQAHSAANGFSVEVMPSVTIDNQRISSTAIRQALATGDLNMAEELLGRPYSISGRVIDGDKLGKQIGFPTANIQLKYNHPPLSGIFVVAVRGAIQSSPATILPGVASLGVRPTIHKNGKPVLEVHLFDFSQDIYGQHLQVDFLHKLRDEEKYADIDTLIVQIKKDVLQAKDFFLTAQNH
ncbi:MAG: bifunctional riboflavin kinase/FAD synthetase [Nitrosomonas sp.]|jgi:riboflavin kinase/FMN adenylyltransferase|uniref:bifunctional riboflavin kinase/FAD synthetase n=1 Tax=Nitrosomonas sp. TaxID=42353 RepID=UPI002733574E|nr:bifunctional riboflavin kinase/FAD synthetase [Nitrosomonas sp.]MDP3281190.1 bifunctional riboflavin kinase/FAD synthetase [Nitrosomonas sp.]MDP3663478.1 bifunctional riboflavin kinase/FAD synthetase [Nitrosomonas sp.]MDZ4104759.1 bifunctional riboflavin kinase/FAD synthetase [Nitrosomonas sp.]